MVQPSHAQGRQEQRLKLQGPKTSFQGQISFPPEPQPVQMKRNVSRLVAEHQPQGGLQRGIIHVLFQQIVIGRADDFGGQQHLNFKPETPGAPGEFEKPVSPMPPHERSAEALDHAGQEAGMFLFLRHEKGQRRQIVRVGFSGGASQQKGASAGLAQLKMRQGNSQDLPQSEWQLTWS